LSFCPGNYIYYDYIVVSAGGRLTINVSSPARTLGSVAEREQLGVMARGKWLYKTFGAMKKKILLIDSSEYKQNLSVVRLD